MAAFTATGLQGPHSSEYAQYMGEGHMEIGEVKEMMLAPRK